jgi:hypothetical protein
MSYDVNFKQSYNHSAETVIESAVKLLDELGGKLSANNNPAKGQLEATFNKKVKDQPLPNRCQLRIKVVSNAADSSNLMAKAFPVDPMGSKLTFGVRGNAAQVVVDTFFQELSTTLGS